MSHAGLFIILSFVIQLIVAFRVYLANPGSTLNKVFAWACLAGAWWSLTDYHVFTAADSVVANFWFRANVIWGFNIALHLHFVLLFTKHPRAKGLKNLLLIYTPYAVLSVVDVLWHEQMFILTKHSWGWFYESVGFTPLYTAFAAVSILGALLPIFLLLKFYHKLPKGPQRFYTVLIIISTFIPGAGGALLQKSIPQYAMYIPAMFNASRLASVLLIWYAMRNFELVGFAFGNSANRLLDAMKDALFVLSEDFFTIYANPAGQYLFKRFNSGELTDFTFLLSEDKRQRFIDQAHELRTVNESRYLESPFTAGSGTLFLSLYISLYSDVHQRIYLVTARDITSQKLLDEELVRRRHYFETVFINVPDAIITVDANHNVKEWNNGAERLFGYARYEATGKHIDSLIAGDNYEEATAISLQVLHKKVISKEVVRTRADGKQVTVLMSVSPIYTAEDYEGAVVVYTDITQKKQVEEELRRRTQDYFGIFENVHDSIVIFDPDTHAVLEANSGACSTYGYNRNEFIGSNILRVCAQPDYCNFEMRRMREEGVAHSFETEHITASGQLFMVDITMSMVIYNERPAVMSIIRDITETRQAEHELVQNEQFLQNLFDAIQDGICVLDMDYNIVRINSYMERKFRGAMPLIGKKCFQVYGLNKQVCTECPARKTRINGEPAEETRYYLDEDSSKVWVQLSTYPLYDEKGQIKGIIEYIRDITARMEAEEQARQSEQRYSDLFENAQIGIYRSDQEGRIVLINPAMMDMLGFENYEQAKDFDIAKMGYASQEDVQEFQHHMLINGQVNGFETIWKRTDGTFINVRENAKAIKDENGTVQYYDGTVENITQRKRAEQELETYRHHLESLVKERTEELEKLNNELVYDINMREHTERALRESEEQYRDLVEKAGVAILIDDASGNITYFNRKFLKLFRLDEDQAYSLKLQNLIHPDDLDHAEHNRLLSFKNQETSTRYEFRGVLPEGGVINVEVDCIPLVEDGLVVGIRSYLWDITERKETENQLRLSDEILRRAGALVVVSDSEGAVTYVSPSVEQILGYKPAQLLGDNWWIMTRKGIKEGMLEKHHIMARAKGKETFRERPYERPALDSNGNQHWILWQDTLGPDGMLIGIGQDISDRKEAERYMREAKEAAEEANRLKSEFFFNISHEIRTPLNVIMGFSELILFNESKNEIDHNAKLILRESDILLQLINQLLDHAKIESGKLELDIERVNLHQLLQDIEAGQIIKAQEKGLQFVLSLSNNLPKVVDVDPLRLRQVLVNLLSNALKFTEQGTVTLTAEVEDKDETVAMVRFSVVDTGIGIAPEKQDKIFESFTQADGSMTRKYGGTGLGTTISRQLVTLMGGEIGLSSKVDKGSRFYFTIPLKHYPDTELANTLSVSSNTAQDYSNIPPATILLVDDYTVNRDIAVQHLSQLPIQVHTAENGKQAVELCSTTQYDLVLIDIQMPIMDGYTAVGIIRKELQAYHDIPIIAMTAHADSETRRRCESMGMSDMIVKPIRRQTFLQTVANWLGNAKQQNGFANLAAQQEAQHVQQETPIDYDLAVSEFAGNEMLLKQVLKPFAELLTGQIAAMREALVLDDFETVRKIAHKIRGGAANLTAMPLSQAAEQVENQAQNNMGKDLDQSLTELELKSKELQRHLVGVLE